MKIFILMGLLAIGLSGCMSATPNYINGNYYLAGDSSCKAGRQISKTRIMCVNKKGQDTGYRDAMTDQQLYMYQQNRQLELQMLSSQPRSTNTTCYNNGYGMISCNSN